MPRPPAYPRLQTLSVDGMLHETMRRMEVLCKDLQVLHRYALLGDGRMLDVVAAMERTQECLPGEPRLGVRGDPATDVAVVLCAARARVELNSGRGVSPSELAALASMSVRTVHNDALPREGEKIPATAAIAWLRGRGILVSPGMPGVRRADGAVVPGRAALHRARS